ncbi:MAG: ABC transporter ATP-binding protein [Nitrososphaerota archaeon]
MAEITIRGLSKRFGKTIAVNNLSLEVNHGEFVCLLGPSGCGKTTTLRCIAGLEEPDEGEIYIGGRLVNNIPPQQRDIAMVFQFYAIYPGMTVYENLAFPLRMKKYSKNEIRNKVIETAKLLQIEHLLDKDAISLHSSEKQRVALGRALVREPEVLLLDEPLSNLDAKLRELMRSELKELQRRLKITTIMVTHDQLEAMSMADRIAVMKDGKLQQYDAPENIYKKPKNLFVAEFIGSPSINLIEGTIHLLEEKIIFEKDTLKLNITEKKNIFKEYIPEKIVLGIRPTEVLISKEYMEGWLEGEVALVELMGDEQLLHISINSTTITALISIAQKINIGEKVFINFKEDGLYIFNSITGSLIV